MQRLQANTYAILCSLCVPATPGEMFYSDIVSKLTGHCTPKPSVIHQRFAFHKRGQQLGDTVADFVADLRRLSEHCEFGDTLQDILRDRLVHSGRRFAATSPGRASVELEQSVGLAVSAEYAIRQAEHIRGALPAGSDLLRIQPSRKDVSRQGGAQASSRATARTPQFCSNCDIDATSCGFRNAECHFWKRRRHIVRACRQKEATRRRTKGGSNRQDKPSGNNTGCVSVYGLYQVMDGLAA